MDLDTKFTFKSQGSAILRPIVSMETDKYLATASVKDLWKYIPNIDTAKNVDLLPVAFDAFVANRVNNNHDVSDSATSVAIAKLFVNKPINVEHNRQHVVGMITNYAFTKFDTHEPLTEEEALATTEPFYITLGGLVWRVVNPKLAKFIEIASDPTSEHYEEVSASWEIGFLDYAIAAIEGDSRDLANATIITDEKELKSLKGYMRAFGGKGSKGELNLYRLVKGEALPLGIGLTGSPAAEVAGIATDVADQEGKVVPGTDIVAEPKIDTSKAADSTNLAQATEIISQSKENIVIQERNAIPMSVTITKLEQITDDLLKQASASQITEFVKEQLKLADEAYQKEKNELSNQVKASKDAAEGLQKDVAKLQTDLKTAADNLTKLTTEQEARARQDVFNSRMLNLDKVYTLGDAEREIIASDIANLDDKSFAAYQKKLEVLLAAKKKVVAAAVTPDPKVVQTAQASTQDAKAVVDAAVDNSAKTKETVVAAAAAGEPTLLDKYQKAFGVDQWLSDVKLTD